MLSGVTQEGYEAAAKFNDQWDDTKKAFNSLWLSANSTILPAFESILKGLEVIVLWVRENQTLVTGFFFAVAGIITAAYLPAIAAAAAATIVAMAPFIAIGAAIVAVGAAFALLYEDFVKWTEGAPSAIGLVLGSFDELSEKIGGIFDSITEKWAAFIGFFMETKDKITGFFSGVGDFFGIDGEISKNTKNGQATIDGYSSNTLNHGGVTTSQSRQVNNVSIGGSTVNAQGMTQQQATGAMNASMKQSVEMAIGQLNDGVAV